MPDIIQTVWTYMVADVIYLLVLIFIALGGVHFYSIAREKKRLLQIVDNKVKVFQKAFDISEDAILILSEENEIVYANRAMKNLLSLPKDFMLKPLPIVPQIKIKSDWVPLDELIDIEQTRADNKMLSYLQTSLSVNNQHDEGIPVNLYVDSGLLGSKYELWCNIISIHDLRQKNREKTLVAKHQLTSLPNQAQLLHDLNALYSKVHLNEQKIALIVIDIDALSALRSILGFEQVNVILIKFAKFLENISTKLDISVYHTYYNNFLISVMEKTGFIVEIGKFVFKEVLKQQKRWELFRFKAIDVAINITLLEINAKNFVENVAKQLQHHQIHPSLIKFEITEGSAMISEESTRKHFWDLKKLGVGISLDDFGTGYTSFSYLKKFPSDIVKIDKTLIDYILTNKEDQKIVRAMIELGHNLGMRVVVEGIGNNRMYELLKSYGCDFMQGYYFGKPLPVFEFQKLLR